MDFERKIEGSGSEIKEVRWGKRDAEEMMILRDEKLGRGKIECHCIRSQ